MENDVTPPVTATEEQVEKGSKTPEPNLYAALEEERRLRKEATERAKVAEEELAKKEVVVQAEEIYSDEGKVLKNQLGQLESKLDDLQKERDVEKVLNTFPALRDKSDEFKEFSKDYPRHKLESVAKIFLAERDMLEVSTRIGLERPTAGPKDAPQSGMSVEDVTNLRKRDYRKYVELIQNGQINPSDIK